MSSEWGGIAMSREVMWGRQVDAGTEGRLTEVSHQLERAWRAAFM